jgi:membrane associated rhomboid family serine protease
MLQFFVPGLLPLLQRDYARFVSGEWWRLVTSLVVQDGGVGGTISNLVALALLGSVGERLWGGRSMLLIFLIGGILTQFVAFAWQPTGAGNSVGNFSVAAGIAVTALKSRHPRPILIAALFALVADGFLLALQDIHGAAALVGAICGLFLIRTRLEGA